MERILLSLQTIAAVGGAAASYLLGGIDNLIIFLLCLTGIDIVTGLLQAIANHELNSEITLKGLIRKAGIYVIIAVCNLADQSLGTNILRDAAISFYIVMELVSITENWGKIGLPLPQKLKDILAQLQEEKVK